MDERSAGWTACVVSGAGAQLLKNLGSLCGKQGAGTCVLAGQAAPGQGTLPKKQKPVAFYHEWKEIIHPLTWLMQEESFQE